MNDTLFHKGNANYVDKTEEYEDWFIEPENEEITKTLDRNMNALYLSDLQDHK